MLSAELGVERAFAAAYPEPVSRPCTVVVYGAGNGGRQFIQKHGGGPDVRVALFCDDDAGKQGGSVEGIPIAAPERLREFPEAIVVVALADRQAAVRRLHGLGLDRYLFSDDFSSHVSPTTFPPPMGVEHFDGRIIEKSWQHIEAFDGLLADQESRDTLRGLLRYRLTRKLTMLHPATYREYRHLRVSAVPHDVVIDAGGFDGDTALLFYETMCDSGSIHVLEPSPVNFAKLRETVARRGLGGRIRAIQAGVGQEDGEARFSDDPASPVSSRLSAEGVVTVPIVSLDTYCRRESIRPTLIKMDIEGFELRALRGAAETIREHGPKLQICVYHLPADLWEIPLYLHSLRQTYRFYLGHHTAHHWSDVVLYAVDA